MADATRSGRQRHRALAALAALALVAGCAQQAETPTEEFDNSSTVVEPLEEEATPIAEPDAPLPPPPPVMSNVTENSTIAIPPEEPTPVDLQVQDDAEATGMTARLPRDAAEGAAE